MTQAPPYIALDYRQDLGILFLRWLQPIADEEFKEGYTNMLEAGNPEKIHCWLIDTRRRGPSNKACEDWFFNTYLPEVNSCLTQPHHIAALITPDHFGYISKAIGFEKFARINKDTLLDIKFFDEEQKAVEWLMRCEEN